MQKGCRESYKTRPNGGLGRPQARCLRFWEPFEHYAIFVVFVVGKKLVKTLQHFDLGRQRAILGATFGRVGEKGGALGKCFARCKNRAWIQACNSARSCPGKPGAAEIKRPALPADPQYMKTWKLWFLGNLNIRNPITETFAAWCFKFVLFEVLVGVCVPIFQPNVKFK